MRRYGFIKGDGDGKYRPADGVSREEFLSILLKVFNVEAKETKSNFSDVNKNEWYYNVVSTAYEMGIVNGYPDGRFGIGDTISRADMAVMICRIMDIQKINLDPVEESFIFKDSVDIPMYAYSSIVKLQTAEIINGDTFGRYNPLNSVTRAEAAVAFWSVFGKVSEIITYSWNTNIY